MSIYRKTFAKLSQHNPDHLETLAYTMARTLSGQPLRFFVKVAAIGEAMGAERLAELHREETE